MKHIADESRFELLGRLGRGGTAEVFRVAVKDLKRQAALKQPLPDQPTSPIDFQKLAARELHLIGGLRFPGLVRLIDAAFGQPDYLLMEVCEGPTLDGIGRIDDPVLALNILSALAVDLEFLRRRHIVHGDLKPHNFFLPTNWQALTGASLFYAKLSDFSLGRFDSEPESTRAGLGTVGYMAPETITEGRSSHRSDLFALGVIAYQLLTGKHPFLHGETDPVRISARVREEIPAPVKTERPDIPPAISALIEQLLAKDENQRPDSAFEICSALAEAGSLYPFERALAPRYFIDLGLPFDENLQRLFSAEERELGRLRLITGGDLPTLSLLLDCNYRRGTIHLAACGYESTDKIYWPSYLRRKTLAQYSILPYTTRRQAIHLTVTAGEQIQGKLAGPLPAGCAALPSLLLPLLRPKTVKRLSEAYAPLAEREEHFVLATKLYLQAGDLEGADRCAYQAAAALRSQHQPALAVQCLNSVLDCASMRDQLSTVRALLMLKGDIQKEAGDIDDALCTYQQIIQLYQKIPPDKLLAETYKDLGDVYKMKQDAVAGLKSLQLALEIFHQLGEELEVSRTYNNIGNSYYYAGDVGQTIRQYRRALRIQRRLEAAAETASTLTNLGSIICLKGHLRRGTFLLQKSLEIKKELGNAGEIARTLNNLGYFLHLSGQSEQAVAALQEALEMNRRIGSKNEMLYNLENLSEVQLAAGFLRDSLTYLADGLALAREYEDKPHQAHFLRSLAVTYVRMGRISDAETTLADLLRLVALIDDPLMNSMLEVVAGEIRAEVGDAAGAAEHFRAAHDKALAAQLKHQQVVSLLWLVRFSEDPTPFDKVLELAKDLGMVRESQQARLNRIEYLLESDRLSDAMVLIAETADSLDALPEALDTPRLLRVAAEALFHIGRREDAARHLARAFRLAQRSSLTSEMSRILLLQGQIESGFGQYEACYAKCRQALQLCKQIADTISTEADRAFFQDTRSVQFLVTEIRRLGKLLEQKQRAGRPALL